MNIGAFLLLAGLIIIVSLGIYVFKKVEKKELDQVVMQVLKETSTHEVETESWRNIKSRPDPVPIPIRSNRKRIKIRRSGYPDYLYIYEDEMLDTDELWEDSLDIGGSCDEDPYLSNHIITANELAEEDRKRRIDESGYISEPEEIHDKEERCTVEEKEFSPVEESHNVGFEDKPSYSEDTMSKNYSGDDDYNSGGGYDSGGGCDDSGSFD